MKLKHYLKEGDSPLTFTHTLMDNQINDFIKLLKMETPPGFENDLKKITKQAHIFKKQLRSFVRSIT